MKNVDKLNLTEWKMWTWTLHISMMWTTRPVEVGGNIPITE